MLLLALALVACNGDTDDTDPDTEAGTEADTDAGTEADTDVDTTPGTNTLEGTLTYAVVNDGYDTAGDPWAPDCATSWGVNGDETPESCADCDWAFTLTASTAVGDCAEPDPLFAPEGGALLGRFTTYEDVSGFDWFVVAPADATDLIAEGTVYEPNRSVWDASLDGTALTLSRDIRTGTVTTDPRYEYSNDCTPPEVTRSTAPITGTSTTGTVPCGVWQHDSFTFTATEGDVLSFSVDTTDPETAFRPNLIFNSPSGCASSLLAYAFDCAEGLPDTRCPGGVMTANETGTWEVLLVDEQRCVGATGGYTLTVSGTTLTPVDDDVRTFGSIRATREVSTLDTTFRFAPE